METGSDDEYTADKVNLDDDDLAEKCFAIKVQHDTSNHDDDDADAHDLDQKVVKKFEDLTVGEDQPVVRLERLQFEGLEKALALSPPCCRGLPCRDFLDVQEHEDHEEEVVFG